ncbi:17573_t:CDS:2, partial [Entrophospora sp. SA101]
DKKDNKNIFKNSSTITRSRATSFSSIKSHTINTTNENSSSRRASKSLSSINSSEKTESIKFLFVFLLFNDLAMLQLLSVFIDCSIDSLVIDLIFLLLTLLNNLFLSEESLLIVE